MSIRGGPDIIEDGLVLHLDAADRNSYPVNPELVTNSNLLTLGDGNFETCLRSSTSTIGLDIGPIVSGKTYQIIWNVSARRGTTSASFRTGFFIVSGSTNANFGTGMRHHVFTSDQTGTLRFYPDNTGCDFDVDYASLREYSGSISDLINTNNGVLTNGPVFTPENAGSVRFDGSNDYIQGPNYQITDYATINVWVNTTQTDTSRPVFDINTTLNGGGFSISWRSGVGIGTVSTTWRDDAWSTGNYPYITSTTNARDGNWHMLTAVYDSVGAKLYVDSILEASSTRNSTLTQVGGQFIRIGLLGNQTTTYYYSGKLASSQLYNRALSADEIRQNYNAIKGRYGLT